MHARAKMQTFFGGPRYAELGGSDHNVGSGQATSMEGAFFFKQTKDNNKKDKLENLVRESAINSSTYIKLSN